MTSTDNKIIIKNNEKQDQGTKNVDIPTTKKITDDKKEKERETDIIKTQSVSKKFAKLITEIDTNDASLKKSYGSFYPDSDELVLRRLAKVNNNIPIFKGAFIKVSKLYLI